MSKGRKLAASASMTYLLFAGCTASGWYLMAKAVPPKDLPNIEFPEDLKPLMWGSLGAFDSLAACEAARARLLKTRRYDPFIATRTSPESVAGEEVTGVAFEKIGLSTTMQCVATSDPRPR